MKKAPEQAAGDGQRGACQIPQGSSSAKSPRTSPQRDDAPASWREAWALASQDTPAIEVTVSRPHSIGGALSRVTMYSVRSGAPFNYVVQRRYTHFSWLRDVLQRRYIGMLLPPLPAKDFINSVYSNRSSALVRGTSEHDESSFIRVRKQQLNMFLREVCRNPYLRSDPAVHMFLSVRDGADWDASRRAVDASGIFEAPSDGLRRWRDLMETVVVAPGALDRAYPEVQKQLREVDGIASALEDAALSLVRDSSALATSASTLARSLRSWREAEASFGDGNSYEMPQEDAIDFSRRMARFLAHITTWRDALSGQTPAAEDVVLARLGYLRRCAKALEELLLSRTRLQKEQASAVATLRMQEAEASRRTSAGARNSIFGGITLASTVFVSNEALPERIQLSIQDATAAERRLQIFEAALYFHSISAFHHQRGAIFDEFASLFSVSSLRFANLMVGNWNGAAETMNIDCAGAEALLGSDDAAGLAKVEE